VGRPTYTRDLAPALAALLETPATGIVHVANEGWCSWFELAQAVERLMGTGCRVVPCLSHEFPRPARRPAYSVLALARWRELGLRPLRPWAEAVQSYMQAHPEEIG
jgi:dTDP-4-dehydrorhamnose reductase